MRLESALFKGSITVKSICARGHELVMETDPNDSVPGSLYITPKDITGMIRLLLSPSVIAYMFMLPFHYIKSKERPDEPKTTTETWW